MSVSLKKMTGIGVFDIEINEKDPDEFIKIVKALEPTFGGVNLEDIKAPECFKIESALIEQLDIPVFHDDQHGTAIVVAAGLFFFVYASASLAQAIEPLHQRIDALTASGHAGIVAPPAGDGEY